MQKGQGTMEYLLVIGRGVLAASVVLVLALSGCVGSNEIMKEADTSIQEKVLIASLSIGIGDELGEVFSEDVTDIDSPITVKDITGAKTVIISNSLGIETTNEGEIYQIKRVGTTETYDLKIVQVIFNRSVPGNRANVELYAHTRS